MEDIELQKYVGTMAGFNTLWARVTGASAGVPSGSTDPLPALMARERSAARRDRSLAGQFSGTVRSRLAAHAAAAKQRADRLRREWFLAVGREPAGTSPSRMPVSCGWIGLRSAMLADGSLAAAYKAAASSASDPERKTLFQEHAQALEQTAREKRAMILAHY